MRAGHPKVMHPKSSPGVTFLLPLLLLWFIESLDLVAETIIFIFFASLPSNARNRFEGTLFAVKAGSERVVTALWHWIAELRRVKMGNGASRPDHPEPRGAHSQLSQQAHERAAHPVSTAQPSGSATQQQQQQQQRAPIGRAPSSSRAQPHAQPKRVSSLTDELLKCKAKLELAEQKLREGEAGIPHTECAVCMDAAVDTVFLPCGHLCSCSACCSLLQKGGPASFKCPLCRENVERAHRIFLPVHQPAPAQARRGRPTETASPAVAPSTQAGSVRTTVSLRPGVTPEQARFDAQARFEATFAPRTPGNSRVAWPEVAPNQANTITEPSGAAALLSKTLPASFQLPVRHTSVR